MKVLSSLFLSFLLLCLLPVWGQAFSPDTSLTYSTFLKQCQTFPNSPKQEVWVVNFWASWDGASLYTLPILRDIYEEYRNKPVRFVSISVDKNRAAWEARLMEYELPWEHLMIPSQADYLFLQRAFIHNSELPAIFLVNTQGIAIPMADIAHLRSELQNLTRPLPNQAYRPTNQLEVVTRPSDAPVVPAEPSPPASSSTDSPWITHTVRKGNTLFSISREYEVPVGTIRSNNGLAGNNIKIGQVLKIKRR
jgi:LysM repeat protein